MSTKETSSVETYTPPANPIEFTQSAAQKVYELICEEENPDLKLRVYVTGGGCSGMQYGFTFDEKLNPDDMQVTTNINPENDTTNTDVAVTMLVDPMSFQYLVGAKIDFQDDLRGAQFIIHNPNAKTSCGCGSSFSVDDDD